MQISVHAQFQITLIFSFPNGDYRIIDQYYIYDISSLIADVGGFLVSWMLILSADNRDKKITFQFKGLCLGVSLLTFYDCVIGTVIFLSKKIQHSD